MTINIYSTYDVIITGEVSYQVEERGNFVTEDINEHFVVDGGKLAEIISKLLVERDFQDITFGDNVIAVSNFDPMNGEGSDRFITIKEIKE